MPSRPKREKPHSDKTSCALGAPPSIKMQPASYRAANCLFSVDVGVIFIADLMRLRRTTQHENGDRTVNRLFSVEIEAIFIADDLS